MRESPWRDMMGVIGVTLVSVILSIYFNVNETLYAITRRGERYQIVIQEALANIFKHASAKPAEITLERIDSAEHELSEMRVAVADDGCGMEPRACMSRFGLNVMRERVEMAGDVFYLRVPRLED